MVFMDRKKQISPRNRTLRLSTEEKEALSGQLLRVNGNVKLEDFRNRIICGDFFNIMEFLPDKFVDLLILDPPYNLDKNFNGLKFSSMSNQSYIDYLEIWMPKLLRLLKVDASVYLCCDWQCSAACFGCWKNTSLSATASSGSGKRAGGQKPTGRTVAKIYGLPLSEKTTLSIWMP